MPGCAMSSSALLKLHAMLCHAALLLCQVRDAFRRYMAQVRDAWDYDAIATSPKLE
jgi:hypothetical protein